jgi:ribosome biogenesis ATPase
MMTASPSNAKLSFLVKSLVRQNVTTWDASEIVSAVQSRNREYQRKNRTELKSSVQTILDSMMQQNNGSSSSSSSSKRRRKEEEEGEEEEEEYDAAARRQDRISQQQSGLGSLNASLLRPAYRRRSSQTETDRATTDVADDDQNPSQPQESTPQKKKKKRMLRKGSSFQEVLFSSTAAASSSSWMMPRSRPAERYTDLGGLEHVLPQLRRTVETPLQRPELYRHLGIDPPRGVLLRGPPGTGKTHLAHAVAGELNVSYFSVSAPELVSSYSGDSERQIRELFRAASASAPALVFLDEIDAIAGSRSGGGNGSAARGMETRIVATLLTSLDRLTPSNNRDGATVLVMAATNRAESLDPALRRAGRFDAEIELGVPDEQARKQMLVSVATPMRVDESVDYQQLARLSPGFVGADLRSLAKEAAVNAIHRICRREQHDDSDSNEPSTTRDGAATPLSIEHMEPLYVTMDDFMTALPLVQPSSKREGFATVPDVSWDDIGALSSIREELTLSVLEPIRHPEKFQALGLPLPAGVMLYGPPGCGKTLLAKAIANESGANFISVKGPELLDKYVGESERAVRRVFERARSSSPCVVFFDELDSLVPKRGSSDGGGGGVSERVVNQLLTEMDGLESRRSVFVIAATNRPELIDPAMMRPGRLDKLLYVPLPSAEERVSILQALAAKVTLGEDVDLSQIGRSARAEGYSGADCAALLREAGLAVMKEDAAAHAAGRPDSVPMCIRAKHFDTAFAHVMPSVSKRDQARYDRMRDRMARARSRGGTDEPGDGSTSESPVQKNDQPPTELTSGYSRSTHDCRLNETR